MTALFRLDNPQPPAVKYKCAEYSSVRVPRGRVQVQYTVLQYYFFGFISKCQTGYYYEVVSNCANLRQLKKIAPIEVSSKSPIEKNFNH